ncbi:MAG: hypothetical protein ACRDBQ_04305 [Shewanella sp.]
MKSYLLTQSFQHLRDIRFTGEFIGECDVTFNDMPYHASLYRTNETPERYVGVMEIYALKQREAVVFSGIATDEMELFFGPEAAFWLFKAAKFEGYQYLGVVDKNVEVTQ